MTVANAIQDALPNESILYFGDTAHLPYGDKSPESIRHYAAKITGFLLQRKCKLIVIACNTASSFAQHIVRDVCGPNVPVIDVINPVAEYVAQKYKQGHVGVIGTKGTIGSRVYSKRIKALEPDIIVSSKATPLLASMIEEGFVHDTISRSVIHKYLSHLSLKGIEALILGCTHYPLIRKEVEEFYEPPIEVIDSGEMVAHKLKALLDEVGGRSKALSSHSFFVSDKTDSFERSTRKFFGERVKLSEARIWD